MKRWFRCVAATGGASEDVLAVDHATAARDHCAGNPRLFRPGVEHVVYVGDLDDEGEPTGTIRGFRVVGRERVDWTAEEVR